MGKVREYWAAMDQKDAVREMGKRVESFHENMNSMGYFRVIRKSYKAYFGSSSQGFAYNSTPDSVEINRGGQNGELSQLKVNHYRNYIQHVLTLITNPRPQLKAMATNTDQKSQAQTRVADDVMEYYMRAKRAERFANEAAEFAMVFGQGFVGLDWDAQEGDEYTRDEDGKKLKTGDLEFSAYSPLDVAMDPNKESYDQGKWVITRRFRNKFDLIAKYPKQEENIINADTKTKINDSFNFFLKGNISDTDDVAMYTFMHRKTPALPEGRMTIFLDNDTVLYDGPLPFRDIPLYRIAPGNFWGSPYGYSAAFDVLGIQEAYDVIFSSLLTNNVTFSTQNVWVPKGSNLNITEISGGLNLLESDGNLGMPQPLNLTASSPESYNFLEMLESKGETLVGLNSVVRGDPQSSLKSGSALALVASQAIQFNSNLQRGFVQLLEDMGTGIIEILQDYAHAPRIVQIAGKFNRPYVEEFTGASISDIKRVTAEVVNAVSKTPAGRLDLANNMMQQGLIKAPEEYFQVLETGRLDPITEGPVAENILIKGENEKLREGIMQPVSAVENHPLHVMEHKTVLATPEAKEDPKIVEAVMAHIFEHVKAMRETDPGVLMMLGMQPLPPNPQTAPPPAQPPQQGAPPPQGASSEPLPPALAAPGMETEMPNMPNPPTNPLSGEQAQLPGQ